MKKIIFTSLLLIVSAATSFAASATSAASVIGDAGKGVFGDKTTATNATAKIGKLSTGVHLAWNTTTASYAIMTQHKSGVRKFGTASDSTAITWVTATKDTIVDAPASPNVLAVLAEGWSVM